MEKKRCQVCDGPIVNGRCKLCGMPYRNDETLYHLNENRSDHYRHATSRARAIMRQEEIPLGDKKTGNRVNSGSTAGKYGQSTAGNRSTGAGYGRGTVKTGSGAAGYGNGTGKTGSGAAGYGNSNGKTGSSAAGYRNGTGKTGSGAAGYGNGTGKTGSGAACCGKSTVKTGSSTSGYGQNAARSRNTAASSGKKTKKKSPIGWIILLIILICTWAPQIRDSLLNTIIEEVNNSFGTDFDVASSVAYEMKSGDIWEVGSEIEPGYYVASCDNGSITFLIQGTDGQTGSMAVSDGMERKITLNEGDWIGIIAASSDDTVLLLTQHYE